MDRKEALTRIKRGLESRSGKRWSVKGGRGTAWGWLTVSAMPAALDEFGDLRQTDRAELATLLDLPMVHHQGVSIPASSDFWREYVDRAEGTTPTVRGEKYWD